MAGAREQCPTQSNHGMQALEFWKTVNVDRANLLESLIQLLNERQVKHCVIGGQAVNAYAEPLVSLDLT